MEKAYARQAHEEPKSVPHVPYKDPAETRPRNGTIDTSPSRMEEKLVARHALESLTGLLSEIVPGFIDTGSNSGTLVAQVAIAVTSCL